MAIRPIPASRVETTTELQWLWQQRVPLLGLSVIQGEGGLGKGLIYVSLAAQLSRGTLPGSISGPANTLIVSLEDEREIVRNRLVAAGADLDRVDIDDGQEIDLLLDVDTLITYIRQRYVRLLVLDPLHTIARAISFDIRRALLAVTRTANIAVIAINHLNANSKVDARGRGLGGRGLQNLSRATHVLVPHPDDGEVQDGLRILAPVKINRGERPRSLAGRVAAIDGQPVWQWIGETDYTADDLLVRRRLRPRPTPDLDDAIDFLQRVLAAGPVPASDVVRRAVERGIAASTLRRAREEVLGVQSRRVGFGPGSHIEWQLPAPTPRSERVDGQSASALPSEWPPASPASPPAPHPLRRPVIDAHEPDMSTCVDDAAVRFSLLELNDIQSEPVPDDHDDGSDESRGNNV